MDLDISLAFDRFWRAGLLRNLQGYGITGQMFDLLQSFLAHRAMNRLDTFTPAAVFTQCSIIASTIFPIFINHLICDIISQIYIYTDDTTH